MHASYASEDDTATTIALPRPLRGRYTCQTARSLPTKSMEIREVALNCLTNPRALHRDLINLDFS